MGLNFGHSRLTRLKNLVLKHCSSLQLKVGQSLKGTDVYIHIYITMVVVTQLILVLIVLDGCFNNVESH